MRSINSARTQHVAGQIDRLVIFARSVFGVPEQASDGLQDATHGGATYMAAAKKTAKKSTKKASTKKAAKKSKK